MVCCGSGDGTPQSCTSAIPEMDFAFGSRNPTDVSQLAPLGVGVSTTKLLTVKVGSFFFRLMIAKCGIIRVTVLIEGCGEN